MLTFFDYYVWYMLQMKFVMPARMIARNDQVEELYKTFKLPTICKP